MQLIKLAR